jgi:hypothetical protein
MCCCLAYATTLVDVLAAYAVAFAYADAIASDVTGVFSLSCLQLSYAAATAAIVALSAVVIACGVAQAGTFCCIGEYTCVGGVAAGAVTVVCAAV